MEKISWIIRITEKRGKSGGENIICITRVEKGQSTWKKRDNIISAILHDGTNFNTFFSGSAWPWSVSKLPSPAPLEKSQLETAGDDV